MFEKSATPIKILHAVDGADILSLIMLRLNTPAFDPPVANAVSWMKRERSVD
jgi:hypothetical protein